MNEGRLPDNLLRLFDDYHQKFDLGSKPAAHLTALAELSDKQLLDGLPSTLSRLVADVRKKLAGLPE